MTLTILTSIFGAGICMLAVHRLNIITGMTRCGIRTQFLLLNGVGVAEVIRLPVFGSPAGWVDVFVTAAVFSYLALGFRRWRHEAPAGTDDSRFNRPPPSDLMGLQ